MIEWQDRALVLGTRSFSDTDAVLTVLSEHHGRTAGLIKGGQSKRKQADLQPGTFGEVDWRARLEDQLGQFIFEATDNRASHFLDDRARLSAVESFCTMAVQTLGEREPVPGLFSAAQAWFSYLGEPFWAELYVKLELGLLGALGFQIDLNACALGGDKTQLSHVSPKTGRAVSADLAAPYAQKLLLLPKFLGGIADLGDQEVSAGLSLSGTLLRRHVFDPMNKDLPTIRHRLAELLFIPNPTR